MWLSGIFLVPVKLQLIILCNKMNTKLVLAELLRLQHSRSGLGLVQSSRISRRLSSTLIHSSLVRLRGGALVPEAGSRNGEKKSRHHVTSNSDCNNRWKLSFNLLSSLKDNDNDSEKKNDSISSSLSSGDEFSVDTLSKDSADYRENDGGSSSSRLSRLNSKLRIKFNKEDAINVVRKHYHSCLSNIRRRREQEGIFEFRGGEHGKLSPLISTATMDLNTSDILQGMTTTPDKSRDDNSIVDRFGRSFALLSAWLVGFQSVNTTLVNRGYDLIDEVATKLLSTESAQAVRNIRSILLHFADFGVVDVLSQYPTKDVISSAIALSRLQHVKLSLSSSHNGAQKSTTLRDNYFDANRSPIGYSDTASATKEYNSTTNLINCDNIDDKLDDELLNNLARYAAFANAAYGWKLGLLSGKLDLSSLAALTRKTGIEKHDLIAANWSSKTHLPAYFIARDVERRKIVLSIRGTLSVKDVLTDLCCTAEDFLTYDDAETGKSNSDHSSSLKYKARAHNGMLAAARGVSKKARKLIASELASNPHYDLIIVGHSLGGGTAAVLGTLWQDTFPGVVVYAYGCPCVGPLDAQPTINKSIISVVGEGDPFSCLSLGHLADVSSALSQLSEDHDLRNEILARTQSDVVNMSKNDLKWSIEKMEALQTNMTAEKFYPPGRILHMGGNLFGGDDSITLKEVTQSTFQDLILHNRMLDLSRHIPHRYEGVLRRISSRIQHNTNGIK